MRPSSTIVASSKTNITDREQKAYAFCSDLARSHYENFPVGSALLPARIRPYIAAVYAFARTADDIADEADALGGHTTPAARHAALDALERSLLLAADGSASDEEPIFIALAHTFANTELDVQPFLRLLEAFRMDVNFTRPQTWDDVLHYCSRSADPVGEIILRLTGECTPEALQASNDVCTALQLTNFWQDLSRDLPAGRVYLPPSITLADAIERTQALFVSGSRVGDLVRSWRLRLELRLIITAGNAMLARCRAMRDQLSERRPALVTSDYFALLGSVLTGQWRLYEHTRLHR